MPSAEVARLWKLAQIDQQIAEIRKQAANLDVGQREQAALNTMAEEEAEVGGKAKSLQQEQTELELIQRADEDKRKKIEKELFGGKVINPREVAALQKEIELVKKKRDKDAERLLELYDISPPAIAAWNEVKARGDKLRAEIARKRAAAAITKKQLEASFAAFAAKRPDAVKAASVNLVNRYETIRKNHAGIGMVEVDRRTGNCSGCGMHLPTRTIQLLKEDNVQSCESCHRILYYTEGAI